MASLQLLANTPCPLCGSISSSSAVSMRDGGRGFLQNCSSCTFSFFDRDPTQILINNQLDQVRLAEAGLDIPDTAEDFANGQRQAEEYVREYLVPEDTQILEVGCSWGYFLEEARVFGANPTGIEINPDRRHYVQDLLHLPCYRNISEVADRPIRFDKIFLFYVMEYFVNPAEELAALYDLLNPGGELIAITPNHHDVLLTTWGNQAFERFVYDACSVNYFTPEAVETLIAEIPAVRTEVTTRQGYSFANHLNWHLRHNPTATGCVGKDRLMEDFSSKLGSTPLGNKLEMLIHSFDTNYRQLIEESNQGNQIHLRIRKGPASAEPV